MKTWVRAGGHNPSPLPSHIAYRVLYKVRQESKTTLTISNLSRSIRLECKEACQSCGLRQSTHTRDHYSREGAEPTAAWQTMGSTQGLGSIYVQCMCRVQAWTKELKRHQSFNVVFTGHFVWGGKAIW